MQDTCCFMSEDEYILKESDVIAYANACLRIAEAIDSINPHGLLCPLRGGLPPTRVVLNLVEHKPRLITTVPTSNYVAHRDELLKIALEDVIATAIDNLASEEAPFTKDKVRILSIDTAISGTSIFHFNEMLKRFLPELQTQYDVVVDYFLAKLWQNPAEAAREKRRKMRFHCNMRDLSINHGVAYVPSLLCEDVDGLLGFKYGFTNVRGIKSPDMESVVDPKPIVVLRSEKDFDLYQGPNAADMLVDILVQYAGKIKVEQTKTIKGPLVVSGN